MPQAFLRNLQCSIQGTADHKCEGRSLCALFAWQRLCEKQTEDIPVKKSITFQLPIIEGDMQLPVGEGLDNEAHAEVVSLLSRV